MSRYGVISDIHGNTHALMAVLERLGQMKVDRIICLGDIVGYGPAPAQCLDLVLSYCDEVQPKPSKDKMTTREEVAVYQEEIKKSMK